MCASIGGFGELVGELQFAFVAFCMCQSLAGFDPRRKYLSLSARLQNEIGWQKT